MFQRGDKIADVIEPLAGAAFFYTRYEAVKTLARMARPRSAEALLRAALDKDEDIDLRIEAIEGLGGIIGPGQAPRLADALSDPSGEIRLAAVRALGKAEDPSVVDGLLTAMEATDVEYDGDDDDDMDWDIQWDIQSQAIKALGAIGDEKAVEPVLRLYKDETSPDLAEVVFPFLAAVGSGKALDTLSEMLLNGGEKERRLAAEALENNESAASLLKKEDLNTALVDESPWVRIAMAKILARREGHGAMAPLIMMLRDSDENVRAEALGRLVEIGGDGLERHVAPLLKDPSPKVRAAAAVAARDFRRAGDHVDRLLRIMELDEDGAALEAAKTLSGYGLDGFSERLAALAKDAKRTSYFRIGLLRLFEEAFPEKIPELVCPLISTEPRQVSVAAAAVIARSAAWDKLLEMADSRIEEIKKEDGAGGEESAGDAAEDEGEEAMEEVPVMIGKRKKNAVKSPGATPGSCRLEDLAHALGETRRKETARTLISCLELKEKPEAAAAAAGSLGRLDAKEARESLEAALSHPSPRVREAAAGALGRIGASESAPRLGKALVSDTDEIVREKAALALGWVKAPEGYDYLTRGLSDEFIAVRKACASALGELGRRRAMGPLAQLLLDYSESSAIFEDILSALQKIDAEKTVDILLETLGSKEQTENHWIAIRALGAISS
ncbi:MAG: HEAT repeat domain-containing protein [Candidatus Nitrospinota bacterium M3_3B_026]